MILKNIFCIYLCLLYKVVIFGVFVYKIDYILM